MVKYTTDYDPNYQDSFPALIWTDYDISRFFCHVVTLYNHGNPSHFHWCCGLDVALRDMNFPAMRVWMSTHERMVRKAMCYALTDTM